METVGSCGGGAPDARQRVSDASQTADLDNSTIRDTVTRTLDQLGPDECYARAAEVFGDRPEVAMDRMAWARELCSRAASLAAA